MAEDLEMEEKVNALSVEIWHLKNGTQNEFKKEMYYNISDYLEDLGDIDKFWEKVKNKDLLELYTGDTDFINESLEGYGHSINDILINEYMKPNGLRQLTEIQDFNPNDLLVVSYHNRRLIMSKVIDLIISEMESKIKGE